jgi:hypothetical protein
MTTRKTDAPMHEPTTDPGGQPTERAPVDQGSVDTPRVNPPTEADLVAVPYEPATNNEDFNRLLNMLSPPATAPPIQSPTTDGELAAQYDASNLRPPRRVATPIPEPPVLLNCTGDIPSPMTRSPATSPNTNARAQELPEVTQKMQPGTKSSWPAQPLVPAAPSDRAPSDQGNRPPRTVMIVKSSMLLPGALIGAASAALLLFLFVCIGMVFSNRPRNGAGATTTTISSAPFVTAATPPLSIPPISTPIPDDIGMPAAPATGTALPSPTSASPTAIDSGRPAASSPKPSAPAGRHDIEAAPPSKKIEREL